MQIDFTEQRADTMRNTLTYAFAAYPDLIEDFIKDMLSGDWRGDTFADGYPLYSAHTCRAWRAWCLHYGHAVEPTYPQRAA